MFELLLNLGLLIASLAALVFIAGRLIDRSVRLAKILGVSGAVIGLTLLAYGTTMPELAVSSVASFQTHEQLSVSNVIGSNICNVAVIMGLVALIVPFAFRKEDLRLDGLFMIASTLVLILLAFLGGIPSVVGIGMVVLPALWTYYAIKRDKKTDADGNKIRKEKGSAGREFFLCCLLLLGVLVAGSFVVQFAVATARLAGVTEWLIGSTIVAAGTSMPEIVVSIISARKRQIGMSLGNIVGANYLNVFWVLGVSAAIRPLSFSIWDIWIDLAFLSVVMALFFAALLRRSISRPEGLLYIMIYCLFVLYLLGIFRF